MRAAFIAAVILLSAVVQWTVVTKTVQLDPIRSDAIKYVAYAWNLKYHDSFSHQAFWVDPEPQHPVPDKLSLPGYPAFLTLFLKGSVDPQFLQRVTRTQAVLGVGTCLFTLLLALRVLPFGFAIGAGVLTAVSPHLATISTNLLTETLFSTLLMAAFFSAVQALTSTGRCWVVACGIFLGLASLVRPQLQGLPWLLLVLCMALPGWRLHASKAILGLLCFLLITAPWTMRNATVDRAPSDPDLLVMTLYHGAFPGLMFENEATTYGYPYRYDPNGDSHSKNISSVAQFIAHGFRRHPLRFAIWYGLGKPLTFLSWTDPANADDIYIYPATASPYFNQPVFMAMRRGMLWLHWPLTLLALGLLWIAVRHPHALSPYPQQRNAIGFLSLTFGYLILLHAIGAPFPRYSVPFRPIVYVLAMAALQAILLNVRERKLRKYAALGQFPVQK